MKQGNLEYLRLGGFCLVYFSLQDGLGRPTSTNIDIIPKDFRHWTHDAANVPPISTLWFVQATSGHMESFFRHQEMYHDTGRRDSW